MSSVAAFRAHYHRKVAVNTAYLVPHGTVRLETVGFRDAPLAGVALEQARQLVRDGLEQGAVGFSTGSSYYPGPWSTTDELVELCETVREAGGVYMSEPRRANARAGLWRWRSGRGARDRSAVRSKASPGPFSYRCIDRRQGRGADGPG